VVGLDADPKALEIARSKMKQEGVNVGFDLSMSVKLPYPDGYFDRVLSSLFFHHLTPESVGRTLREVFRVLRPRGQLHVADWGKPQNWLMRLAILSVQLLDGFETTAMNVRGDLPEVIRSAGFEEVQERSRQMTMFGTLSLYEGKKLVTKL
jgi:ubiquinone/menaquinone biosynthesis C-methylase UbiE